MSRPSDPTDLKRLSGPPSQEGWYWFTGEAGGREMLFEVRWLDGQLVMKRLFGDDVPVAEARGSWRGPLSQ